MGFHRQRQNGGETANMQKKATSAEREKKNQLKLNMIHSFWSKQVNCLPWEKRTTITFIQGEAN